MRGYLLFAGVLAWTATVVILWFAWLDADDPWGLDKTIAWGIYLGGLAVLALLWGAIEFAVYVWRSLANRDAKRL